MCLLIAWCPTHCGGEEEEAPLGMGWLECMCCIYNFANRLLKVCKLVLGDVIPLILNVVKLALV